MKSANSGIITLILIFITGVMLRFVFLDRISFWSDELQTIELACPLKTSMEIVHRNLTIPDQSPPLFTLLLHAWMKIPNAEEKLYPSETWIRFLPALISLFSLFFLVRIFVLPWRGPISVGTCLIFCLSSFYLYFSREVRPYGLLLLMALLSTWAFLKLLERDRRLDSIIYSVSILFGVLTNPFMWLVFISHCVYFLILRDKKKLYRIIILAIPSIVMYLPYMFIILRQFKIYGRPSVFSFFVFKKIAGLFLHLTLGFNFPTNIIPERYSIFLQDPLFLLSLIIILSVWGFSLIKWPEICRDDRLAFLSLIHAIVSVILVFFIYPRRLGPRTLVIIAPFFHYLLVRGIFFKGSLQPAKAAGTIFLGLTLFFGFRFVTHKVNPYIPEDWRGLAREIKMEAQPDALFVMDSVDNLLLHYYLDESDGANIVTYDVKADISVWPMLKDSLNGSNYSKIILLRKIVSPYSSLNQPHLIEAIFQKLTLQFRLENVQSFGERLSLCTFIKNDARN